MRTTTPEIDSGSTALRLMPPLTITEEELDRAVEIVDRVLGRIESGTPK